MKTFPRFGRSLLVCTVAALLCSSARAVTINVPNFSFQDYNTNGTFVGADTAAPDWVTSAAGPNYHFNGVQTTGTGAGQQYPNAGSQDGDQHAFINYDTATSTGYFTNAANLTTVAANTLYTLTIAVGNPNGTGNFQNTGSVSLGFVTNFATPPGGISPVLTSGTTLNPGTDLAEGRFTDVTATLDTSLAQFSGLVGQTLRVAFEATNTGGGEQAGFDNVRLTAVVVPEPSAWAALLTASGLLAGVQRLRRRKSF